MTQIWIHKFLGARGVVANEFLLSLGFISAWRTGSGIDIHCGVAGMVFALGFHEVTHTGVLWTIPNCGYAFIDAMEMHGFSNYLFAFYCKCNYFEDGM
jgi:hypothetical protein